jgi:hypothetical protein
MKKTNIIVLSLLGLALVQFQSAVAQEATLLNHYTLDGTLNDENGGSPLSPTKETQVQYAADAPSGRSQSVIFGDDSSQETSRLILPKDAKLPSESGSVTMWIKAPDYTPPPQGTRFVFNAPGAQKDTPGKTSGCFITLAGPKGTLNFTLGGGDKISHDLADLAEWTHLAITWSGDRKSVILYANGRKITEGNIPNGPLQSQTHPIRVGGFTTMPGMDPGDTQFHGMVSDLRIYEGELTEEEISQLANP